MLFSHVVCAVESFRLASDRPGAFGDELLVEGWFLAHAAVSAMSVRFAGGLTLDIHDRMRDSEGRDSEGLVPFYLQTFGEDTRHRRFLLVEPMGLRDWDFASAVFEVGFEDGGRMSWPIGAMFERNVASEFSADEASLVMSFESVGDNCEFGLVQRQIGQQRLSLLRYAGVGNVLALAHGISGGLRVFDEPDCVEISQFGDEWIANVPALQLNFHTGRSVSSVSLERIGQEETRKLTFMAQKFIDDCEMAGKIFVYRVHRDARGGPDGTRGIDETYAALRRHGPARLVWVNVEDDAQPHGTIVHVRGWLYRAWIDHLAPHANAFDFRARSWLDVLAAARALMA